MRRAKGFAGWTRLLGLEFPFLAVALEVEGEGGTVDGGLDVGADLVRGGRFDFYDAEGWRVADEKETLQGFRFPLAGSFDDQTARARTIGTEAGGQSVEVLMTQGPEKRLDGGFRRTQSGIGPGVIHHKALFGRRRWARRRICDSG